MYLWTVTILGTISYSIQRRGWSRTTSTCGRCFQVNSKRVYVYSSCVNMLYIFFIVFGTVQSMQFEKMMSVSCIYVMCMHAACLYTACNTLACIMQRIHCTVCLFSNIDIYVHCMPAWNSVRSTSIPSKASSSLLLQSLTRMRLSATGPSCLISSTQSVHLLICMCVYRYIDIIIYYC